MSAIPIIEYILGLGVFGLVYWILDGIKEVFINVNIHQRTVVWDLLQYIWLGTLIIYIVFGAWYTIRKYNESEYQMGMI